MALASGTESFDQVETIAQRHGFPAEAASVLLEALRRNGGRMAQFSHPALGGMGQWSAGGMIMIGDMFNHGLKARVDALCNDLSAMLAAHPAAFDTATATSRDNSRPTTGPGHWWPEALGVPAAVGSQNDTRYAYFPQTRRLAVESRGNLTVYATGDHQISGFSQQQSSSNTHTFTSQLGTVSVDQLEKV